MLSNAEKSTEGHTPKNDVNGTLALGNPGTSKSAGERDRKRLALRARNLEIWHKGPQEPSGSLDSSMKKNTGFIKRVRLGLGVDAKAQLLKECSVLNLDKYVEELTQAIPEGLTKCTLAKDCLAAAEIISELHARFEPATFAHPLTAALGSSLAPASRSALQALPLDQREREESSRVSRQKALLRAAAELALVEILRDPGLSHKTADGSTPQAHGADWLFAVLKDLLATDREHANVPILIALLKSYGSQLLGSSLESTVEALSAETDKGEPSQDKSKLPSVAPPLLDIDHSNKFRKLCETYYTTLCKRIVNEHQKLQEQNRRNHEAYIKSGDVFEDRQQRYEKMTKSFERVYENGKILSDLLGVAMAELPDQSRSTGATGLGINLDSRSNLAEQRSDEEFASGKSPWEDEDTRRFYEEIVDLRDMVPASILGNVAAQGNKTNSSSAATEAVATLPNENNDSSAIPSGSLQGGESGVKSPERAASPLTTQQAEAATEESMQGGAGAQLNALLARLPDQTNRSMIDSAAVEFAFLNSKAARKRLVKHLTAIPRNRSDLIPYYARLVATLAPHMPDVAKGILDALDEEFRYFQKKRMADLAESRAKNARFIGELTKFKITPQHTIFHCFKVCLDDFAGANIDILAVLLETCGRYLLRSDATTERTRGLLEMLRRKRAVQNLDHRQVLLLDNAYYQCNPPENKAVEAKQRSTLELYIRHLIYDVLNRRTFERVLKLLRKLPWSDTEVLTVLSEVFLRVWRIKFSNIYLLALLLADLQPHHPDFVISVIDAVCEETRIGMEQNLFKFNQRRMAMVQYLSELYIYRLVNSSIIFDQLWSFITFGHPNGRPLPGQIVTMDSPDDYFRLRLICVLLDTCGPCFNKGSLKKRLDEFLAYLNLYISTKEQPLPMDVDFMLSDTLEVIRPQFQLKRDWESAAMAADAIAAAYRRSEQGPVATQGAKAPQEQISSPALDDEESDDDDDDDDDEDEDDVDADSGSEDGGRGGDDVGARSGRGRGGRLENDEGDGKADVASDDDQSDSAGSGGDGSSDSSEDGEDEEEENEEEDPVVRRRIAEQSAEEQEAEAEFARELAKMMAETTISGSTGASGGGNSAGGQHRHVHQRGLFDQGLPFIKKASRSRVEGEDGEGNAVEGRMRFELLSKRGNKHQAHTLHLPADSAIAVTIREKQLQEQQERRQLKEYVLGYEGREDEQERHALEQALNRQSYRGREFTPSRR